MDRVEGQRPGEMDHSEELPFALLEAPPIVNSLTAARDEECETSARLQSAAVEAGRSTRGARNHASLLQESTLIPETNSQLIDVAASLLAAQSLLGSSYHPTAAAGDQSLMQTVSLEHSTREPFPDRVRFSQLLRQASNSLETLDRRNLAVVDEDHSAASGSELMDQSRKTRFAGDESHPPAHMEEEPRYSGLENSSKSSILCLQTRSLAETIIPAGPDSSLHRSEDRRLATLAGALGTRTGDHSFAVAIEIAPACGSVQDIVAVLGNPDMLPLWCDAVRTVIVTQSSERSRSVEAEPSSGEGHREYEGEWVEATCSSLVPPKGTSWWLRASQSLASAFGFPSYGRVQMFVERQRAQIGITLAPFPGSLEVSHKFDVVFNPHTDRIRVVDSVTLQQDGSDDSSCCGVSGALSSFLLPSIEDYMDQCLSSMARLRFLVENRESCTWNASHAEGTEEAVWQASAPLLASHGPH